MVWPVKRPQSEFYGEAVRTYSRHKACEVVMEILVFRDFKHGTHQLNGLGTPALPL